MIAPVPVHCFSITLNPLADDDQGEQKLNKLSDKKLTDHPTLLNEVSNTQSNSKNYQVCIGHLKYRCLAKVKSRFPL